MSKTILYIDGENLKHYVKDVLMNNGVNPKDIDYSKLNYSNLFNQILKGYKIDQKIFYSAKLHEHPDSLDKSRQLIKAQRALKTVLESSGFNFLVSGHVRPQKVNSHDIFKEKGVDVKIAVDLVSNACDRSIHKAILCSSDSDLQPAIKETRKRGVEVVYVGFERNPNKGLTYTTNKTILIRDSEIIDNYNNVAGTKVAKKKKLKKPKTK